MKLGIHVARHSPHMYYSIKTDIILALVLIELFSFSTSIAVHSALLLLNLILDVDFICNMQSRRIKVSSRRDLGDSLW